MGIRNNGKNVQRMSWIVLTDATYSLVAIANEYGVPNSVYNAECIGPKEWNTRGGIEVSVVRLSATRREFLDILKDFKDSYPDANIVVMKN